MTTVIRCSATDRVLACASSLYETAVPYNPNSPEAREGQAAHECMARVVMGEDPRIEETAQAYGIEEYSLSILVAMGRQAWTRLAPHFDDPHAECAVETELAPGIILRGTSDVINLGGELLVADWKAGWRPYVHPGQLMSYALAAAETHGWPADGVVRAWEVWIRLGEIRAHAFTRETLERHGRELAAQVERVGRQYGPGETACKYCPHQLHCKARDEWLRATASALMTAQAVATVSPEAMTPTVLGSLYSRSRALYAALRRYDSAIDAMLVDGPVPLGDGSMLTLEENPSEKLVASQVMGWARHDLTASADELDEMFSATKSGLERVLKGRAPKGQGAKAVREAMDVLRASGAVETVTKQTKKVVTTGGDE